MNSLQSRARWAGVVYLGMSVLGAPALLLFPKFIVLGDAAGTAQHIASSEAMYRWLMLGGLAGSILFIVLGWRLYHLFEQVDRKLAHLLLLFVVVSATLGILDVALLSPPLVFQSSANASAFAALTRPQIDALAYAFLRVRVYELRVDEALWGLWLVPFGVLVIKSGFIPRIIGVVLLIASTGYIAMSAAYIAFPAQLSAVDSVASILIQCELLIILWLLIKGARRDVTVPLATPMAVAAGQ